MSDIDIKVGLIENLSGISGPYLKVTVSFLESFNLCGRKYTHGAKVTTFIEKKDQTLSELDAEAKTAAIEVLRGLIKGQC